jgi:hypothetical protein
MLAHGFGAIEDDSEDGSEAGETLKRRLGWAGTTLAFPRSAPEAA